MLVPMPCANRPPHLFSLKLSTAKPTMLAQQPASAAPPASPVRLNAAQIAALLIGRVSAIPTITEMIIPIKNGCSSVAHMIAAPTLLAAFPIAGARSIARRLPITIVTNGVTIISILVSFETAFPNSAASTVMIRTASGPPAPPSVLAAEPTATSENRTSGGQWRAYPMATAIAGPVAALAYPPIVTNRAMPSCSPSVAMIVPINNEANSPCAIAPRASIPYLFAEISISFRLRNSLNFFIGISFLKYI